MEEKKNSRTSLAMLIFSMFIFGTIGIFRRHIPLSSGLLAFVRGIVGSGFLAGTVKCRGKKLFHGLSAPTLCRLVVSGGLIGANWILLFEAYNYTTVSVATLCYYMEPIFVTLASAVLFREKLTRKKGICTCAALLGMVLVSGVVESGIPRAGEAKGILYGLGAAALYAIVVLMNKSLSGVDAYEKTVIQLSSAAIVLIPYLALTEDFSHLAITPGIVGLLLVVGILHTGITYALYFGSMDGLRTQTIAIFSYIDPLTALVLSALLLHEQMSLLGMAGAVLTLGSTIISEVDFGRKTAAQ